MTATGISTSALETHAVAGGRRAQVLTAAGDTFALLLAALLPWSTSGVAIIALALFLVVAAVSDWRLLWASFRRPACFSSFALCFISIVGIFWSEADVTTGLHAFGPTIKFLCLPFYLFYFENGPQSRTIFGIFVSSSAVLMIYSFVVVFVPHLALKTGRCCGEDYGVPVKNYIDQSQIFVLCSLSLMCIAVYLLKNDRRLPAALAGLAAIAFSTNLIFVVASRTAIVSAPLLLLVLAWRHGKWRGLVAAMAMSIVIGAVAYASSDRLRTRISSAHSQFQEYQDLDAPSSVGKRLEFWRKSIGFFVRAPILGHGTGSAQGLFEQAAVGQTGAAAEVISNPHNQTLNVAVQWGMLGVLVLLGFWTSHLTLFASPGLVADLGLLVVAQNILGSLFNSHLFDFTEGWLYVLGVSLAGGVLANHKSMKSDQSKGLPEKQQATPQSRLN